MKPDKKTKWIFSIAVGKGGVGKSIFSAAMGATLAKEETRKAKADFSDEEVEEIITFMEKLDDNIFSGTNRSTWKLRMYFKPSDVVNFLISRGVIHEAFYRANH
jgi:Mrp family chromosome partitioning ATPase